VVAYPLPSIRLAPLAECQRFISYQSVEDDPAGWVVDGERRHAGRQEELIPRGNYSTASVACLTPLVTLRAGLHLFNNNTTTSTASNPQGADVFIRHQFHA
jgi:hypothetical protein